MKKIWKDMIVVLCFISIYVALIYAHEMHMENVIVKELPYVMILLVTAVVLVWGTDKLKTLQSKAKLNQKMRDLSECYDFTFDEDAHTLTNCEHMLEQFHQQMKHNELNLNMFEYRYRKIADITGQVIFEYNIVNNTICDSHNWHAVNVADQFIEDSIKHKLVHPDDANVFYNFFTNPPVIGTIYEISVRLCTKSEPTYYITQIRGIVLEGLNGNIEKIIGIKVQKEKA